MAVDIDLDAVGAFVAVAQAADGGGLTDAFDAIGATHADDHQGLVLHRVHRQLVRANGGEVDDDRLDRLDGAIRHGNTRWVLYRFTADFVPASFQAANIELVSSNTLKV